MILLFEEICTLLLRIFFSSRKLLCICFELAGLTAVDKACLACSLKFYVGRQSCLSSVYFSARNTAIIHGTSFVWASFVARQKQHDPEFGFPLVICGISST